MTAPPLWQDEYSTVWCGDNAVVMARLHAAGGRYDLIGPTSPPYNLGNKVVVTGNPHDLVDHRLASLTPDGDRYGTHDDAMPMDEYIEWQRSFTRQAFCLLSETGAFVYQHKPRYLHREIWPTEYVHPELAPFLRQTIILDRRGGLNFNATYYVPSYEVLLIYAMPDWRLADGGWTAKSVWLMPQTPRGRWHPAPFDKSIPKRLIETMAPASVLDPFMGSGTTLIAARELGVEGHGIELHEPFAVRAVQDIYKTQVGFLTPRKAMRTRRREAAAAQGVFEL